MAEHYLSKSDGRRVCRNGPGGISNGSRAFLPPGVPNGPALDALAKSTLESEMSTELMIEKIRKGALRKPKFSHFSEIIQLENSPSLSLSGRLSLGKASGLSDLTKLRMEHDFRQRSQRGAKNSVKYLRIRVNRE